MKKIIIFSTVLLYTTIMSAQTSFYAAEDNIDGWDDPIVRSWDNGNAAITYYNVNNATNTVRIELPYSEGDSLLLNITVAGQPVDSGMFYNITDNELTLVMPDSGSYEARLCRFCRRNNGKIIYCICV